MEEIPQTLSSSLQNADYEGEVGRNKSSKYELFSRPSSALFLKVNLLDELTLLRNKQIFNKSFRKRVQPFSPSYGTSRESDSGEQTNSKHDGLSATMKSGSARPKTAPASSWTKQKGNKNSAQNRPSTAMVSSSSFPDDNSVSADEYFEDINYAELLKRPWCTPRQFQRAFNHQISIYPKNAKITFDNIKNSFKPSSCYTLSENASEKVLVSMLNLNKKSVVFTGILLIFDPCTNTNYEVITIQVNYNEKSDDVAKEVLFDVCGNGGPFQLKYFNSTDHQNESLLSNTVSSKENSYDLPTPASSPTKEGHVSKSQRRVLPGWNHSSPIFIPSLRCEIEWKGNNQLHPSVSFLAVPCNSLVDGLERVDAMLLQDQQYKTANLILPGGDPAINIAALNGNIEVFNEEFTCYPLYSQIHKY